MPPSWGTGPGVGLPYTAAPTTLGASAGVCSSSFLPLLQVRLLSRITNAGWRPFCRVSQARHASPPAPIHPKVKHQEGGRPRFARNVRRSRTQTMISLPSTPSPPPAPPPSAPQHPRHGPPGLPLPGPHCCPIRAMPSARGRSPGAAAPPCPQPRLAAGAGSAHTFPS